MRFARQEGLQLSWKKRTSSLPPTPVLPPSPGKSRRPATSPHPRRAPPLLSGKMPVSSVAKPLSSKPNPFDSDSDSEFTSRRARASSSNSVDPGANGRYKNGFRDSGGFDNQSVQELEGYVAHKAEEVTQKVNVCLRLAENIKEDATNTMIALHKQGQQMNRTHETAANIDQDLSRSETLLGSLGGFFSKTWKPKKTRQIKGPAVISRDDPFKRRANHLEQREKLGLSSSPVGKSDPQKYSDPTNAMEKVQVEKDKQDNALSDLSDVLGQLKGMALDMGSEIDRYVLHRLQQNKAMDGLQDDVEELNSRVKGANQRARRLLGK
ncbi:putative SNAP25 homologous protein SNAP30 isoform X2 [Triticum aestivum]|uniref:putative SNAP25 homologous protein SNAP30 isoform X2 n=1 Tax=Triticum aestivum TaxID=4565 RepID=UPI001D00994F|nr:putative SNAP25 homologous protein SNAP30 isoform X2 [Triticum aestivum]